MWLIILKKGAFNKWIDGDSQQRNDYKEKNKTNEKLGILYIAIYNII